MVLRIGYSLTGQQNRPASPEATGLEVDKLNKGYVKAYFDNYLDQYKDATGGLMGKRGLQYMITDSWEAGVANWTDDMIAEFAKRRGYDMKPWLPALTGRIVESAEATDRFLWDFRKTLTEMTAEYHYDQLTDLLAARGMARYTESHENGRAFIADGMEVKAKAAIPMSAMWTAQANRPSSQFDADIRESASVAHIYGQNLVAAESLTAGSGAWSFSPETLKPTADRELSMGLNRFVIHTSVHQPVNDKIPGLGLGPFGQWFTRHETWAEQAKVWTTYLARSSYMLQQGKFVADIVYYYGEDSNVTALFQGNPPPIPAGYNFDYVNSDVVKNRLTVSPAGLLTTATGMSYRVLALDPNSQHMPLAVLRKIRDMVNAGAVVVGPKPIESPSLSDDAAEFKTIADQLWGGTTGKGKVLTGSIADALASLKVAADFEYTKPQADTELAFVHRKLADGDVYWVSHRNDRAEEVEATLPRAGQGAGALARRHGRGRTGVLPDGRGPHHRVADAAAERRRVRGVPQGGHGAVAHDRQAGGDDARGRSTGSWDVAFQPNRGAPAKITLPALASWHEHADPGVKYFSGTGTYTKTIQAPAEWFQAGAKLWLDLGDVKNIAEVTVNGKPLGTFWKAPFRVDVTSALKPGANTLEIKVINLWVNRLIGDQQEGVTKKYTYTAQQFYRADSPLLPSGLIGPVQVVGTWRVSPLLMSQTWRREVHHAQEARMHGSGGDGGARPGRRRVRAGARSAGAGGGAAGGGSAGTADRLAGDPPRQEGHLQAAGAQGRHRGAERQLGPGHQHSDDEGRPGHLVGHRGPARRATVGLLLQRGRPQGDGPRQRRVPARRPALRQPPHDHRAGVRRVDVHAGHPARHRVGRLVPVGDPEAAWPPDVRLHAAGLRVEHREVPGVLPAARRRRRRGRVGDDGPRQHHPRQHDRGGQGEADDRRHAERQRDADRVAGLRVRSDAAGARGGARRRLLR